MLTTPIIRLVDLSRHFAVAVAFAALIASVGLGWFVATHFKINTDVNQLLAADLPCLRRVRALEEAGYIRGYHADVAAEKLGYGITVFTLVSLTNHAESDLNNFAKLCEGWPQVRECYMMTGDSDFIIRIVAEDWEAFQNFLTHKLAAAPNVAHYKSAPAMQRTKYEPGVPIDDKSGAAPLKKE